MVDSNNNSWYVRRGSSLQGPYAHDELQRYLLLGRVRPSDRVSADGRTWYRLSDCEDLIPEAMRDLDTPEGQARYEAARQAADERGRQGEAVVLPGGRRAIDPAPTTRRGVIGIAMAALAAVGAALLVIGWYGDFGHVADSPPDCGAPAVPGVNWSYCVHDGLRLAAGTDLRGMKGVSVSLREAQLAGTGLQDADLVRAKLDGANLERAVLDAADLSGADLRGARLAGASLVGTVLRHADLRHAVLDGADLERADLSHAAWDDGVSCREDSIGYCRH